MAARIHVVAGAGLCVLLAGCPRLVTPGGGVVIDAVSVEPVRGRTHAAVDEVCGFSGDTLVVRGTGWDPATAQLRVGATALKLASATAGELRGVVPTEATAGDITVVSGNRASPPAARRFCHLGPGHLADPRFRGIVEPRLTIMASGVAGLPCPPVGLSSGRSCATDAPDAGAGPADAGAQPDAGNNPHCDYLDSQRHTVAVAFGLGATFTASDPIFVARMVPQVGQATRSAPRRPLRARRACTGSVKAPAAHSGWATKSRLSRLTRSSWPRCAGRCRWTWSPRRSARWDRS